ncbi:MAG: hypothetical protein ACOVOD_07570 [Rhodoferax sp.]
MSANSGSKIVYDEVDPSLLVQLAGDALAVIGMVQLGTSVIGQLLAYSAPEVEDGTVCSETVEALGWLLSELNDAAATLMVLVAECRQRTMTHSSQTHLKIIPVKF